jgi:AAA ATPase domain/S1 RNA binding domain
MRLRRARFKNILSFLDASLTCDHHVTALIGPNDAGKSNILRILHRVAGETPNLELLADMRCWFAPRPEPSINLSFIAEVKERDRLAAITGLAQLPPGTFELALSCQQGSLLLRVGEQTREFSRQEGEGVLKQLLYSVFVKPDLRALRPAIPFKEVIDSEPSPEVRLFSQIGLTLNDLNSIFLGSRRGQEALTHAGDRLTALVQKVWKQDKQDPVPLLLSLSPNVGATFEESALDIMVSDHVEHALVSLAQRGAGLQWFLALLVQLHEKPQRESSLCTLFLIDEPGVFLHPGGQADLQSVLYELSTNAANQVIYTTHSPFMLDWTRPHEVRVIEKGRDPQTPATRIVDKPYHSNERLNFWEPFRRSIGLFIGDMGLLGDKNLLVEGVSDQIIISHLARMVGQLSGWRIIPAGTTEACAFIARICKQSGRQVAVLVDGDGGGNAYLNALRKYDCADVSIHNLIEFSRCPINGGAFCIEDFLPVTGYLAAINEAYGEYSWYERRIDEAEIAPFDSGQPIVDRIKQAFEARTWPDGKQHEFRKTDVCIHLASSRKQFQLSDLNGNFIALSERLSNPLGPIKLGVVEESVGDNDPHSWSANFTLAVRKGVGINRIIVGADTSKRDSTDTKTEWIFPAEDSAITKRTIGLPSTRGPVLTGIDKAPKESSFDADATAAQDLISDSPDDGQETPSEVPHFREGEHQVFGEHTGGGITPCDGKEMGTQGPQDERSNVENPTNNGIAVFDCWLRKWLKDVGSSFLKDGAAIVRIQGSRALQRASKLSFVIAYSNGEIETFTVPDPSDGFRRELNRGDIVNGTVVSIDDFPPGFWVTIDGYDSKGFVHVTQIAHEYIHDVSDYVSVGQRVVVEYLGYDYGRTQLSILDVKQPN